MRPHLGIESVSVHAEIPWGVTVAYDARVHVDERHFAHAIALPLASLLISAFLIWALHEVSGRIVLSRLLSSAKVKSGKER